MVFAKSLPPSAMGRFTCISLFAACFGKEGSIGRNEVLGVDSVHLDRFPELPASVYSAKIARTLLAPEISLGWHVRALFVRIT